MTPLAKLLAQLKNLQEQLAMLRAKRPTKILPVMQAKADAIVRDMFLLGHPVMVFQGFRSFEEQDRLYAQGRTRIGAIVTNAKGGESLHNYGCAVDIVFVVNGKPSWAESHPWELLGRLGKTHGCEWGGSWTSFPDRPHFQYTGGYVLSDFKNGRVDYKKIV